jgi:UPF0755 protein
MSGRGVLRVGLLVAGLTGTGCGAPPPRGEPVRVTIPQGASLAAVADTLEARGIVASARRFRLYATLRRRDRAIQAGLYDLHRDRPIPEVLDVLVSGRAAFQRLVVPEGLMLSEVAAEVERQLGIPSDSVLAAARDPALIARVAPGAPTLEGYLYPSTYFVPLPATARAVVTQMVGQFEDAWQPAWTARLDSLEMTRHQIVTLASIIEGEVRHDRDRAYVSSVYHNRLRAGWRLQADPTVIYALGRRRRLFERDYLYPSPYNTYLHDGLPPGPIGQPAAASLEAALYPADTDFFFLVARSDGQHVFSRTLAEHRAAVNRIRDGS